MSTTAPYPLLSDSLKGLGLDVGTLFFALNYEHTKIAPKGMFKRFKKQKARLILILLAYYMTMIAISATSFGSKTTRPSRVCVSSR